MQADRITSANTVRFIRLDFDDIPADSAAQSKAPGHDLPIQ